MPDSWTTPSPAGSLASTEVLELQLRPGAGSGRRTGLEDGLRQAIQSRRLAAGTLLPSTRALAADLGLSRGTVVAAYDQLLSEGYLEARQGAGTRVVDLGPSPAPATEPAPPPGSRLNLRSGRPSGEIFPVATWSRCSRSALASAPAQAFGYGDPGGRRELREQVAAYLGRARGVQADAQQIVITSGSTQALSLLAGVLARAGSATTAMEDPCFSYHRQVVERAGHQVVPVPVDGRGLVVEELGHRGGATPGAVVVTPAHQYPTGVALDAGRRLALISWARATGGLIIEDDYDGEFRYDRQPIGALQGMAPDHVAYLGTVSKTLGPGVRLGWAVLPRHLVEPVTQAKLYTDFSSCTLTQLTMAELIAQHHYERQIRRLRHVYRRRRDLFDLTMQPLAGRLGARPAGRTAAGTQTLVPLPDGGPTEQGMIALAAGRGLALEGLAGHWHTPGPRPQALLIGMARPSDGSYPAAVGLLGRLLDEALPPRRLTPDS